MTVVDVRISALEHHVYCPRQAALIHADQRWTDNVHTVRGTRGHRRVDSGEVKQERGRVVVRSLEVWSGRWGMIGRCDAVEVEDGRITPVEYKIGARHGIAADLQVCAQAMCLEEMLDVRIPVGVVFYSATRRRDTVDLTPELRRLVVNAVVKVRTAVVTGVLPPAPNDARCNQCQLIGHCLPGVVADSSRVNRYVEEVVLACDF